MRDWRWFNPPKVDRVKRNARSAAGMALRRGQLKRKPCELCGSDEVQMHHDDYSKPLAVRWLCRAHHVATHQDLNPQQPIA